jgi:acetoin utilization protein AcuC
MRAFKEAAVPLIGAFGPDVIVFELGADALAGDPLAHLCLTNNVYVEIINYLIGLDKPVLMTGGGGYNLDNTVRAWSLAWSIFAGGEGGVDSGDIVLDSSGQQGGLRDKAPAVSGPQRATVMPGVEAVIKEVKRRVFAVHGL